MLYEADLFLNNLYTFNTRQGQIFKYSGATWQCCKSQINILILAKYKLTIQIGMPPPPLAKKRFYLGQSPKCGWVGSVGPKLLLITVFMASLTPFVENFLQIYVRSPKSMKSWGFRVLNLWGGWVGSKVWDLKFGRRHLYYKL